MLRMTWKWALPALVTGALAAAVQAADIRFIVFSSSMGAGDVATRNLMQSFGHTVTVKSAHSSSAADTTGQDLVVISSSVGLGEVNSKFRDVAKPVLIMKYGLFDEMGMVSAASGQAGGFAGYQTTILAPAHPLAAGLSGTLTVFSPADNLNWGMPAEGALRIAALQGDHDRVTIFAYESGFPMVGMNAPARRLAFFYRDNGAARSTEQGRALFRAAIDWSLGADGPPQSAPVITTQPAPVTVTAGQTASFTVTASGSPDPAFQWFRNGIPIPGATGATYTTPATGPADDSSVFTATAANPAGSAASAAAVLRVAYAPIIMEHPLPLTVDAGGAVSLAVSARGNPAVTYQWRKNGVDIPWGLGDSMLFTATSLDDSTVYQVLVRNSEGTAVSHPVLLRVRQLPNFVLPSFSSLEGQPGDSVTVEFLARGYPAPTYSWTSSNPSPGTVVEDRIFRIAIPEGPAGTSQSYAVTASNVVGSASRTVIVTSTGFSAPVITIQPDSAYSFSGSPANFMVRATGYPAPTFQWRRNGTDIPGATSGIYTLQAPTYLDDGAGFSVVVSNSAGSVTSQTAWLQVRDAPVILAQPASATVPAGQPHTFEVTAWGVPYAYYQWRRNGVNIAGATSSTYTLPGATEGDHGASFSVVVYNVHGADTSDAAVLTVLSLPVVTAEPTPVSILEGGQAHFFVTATSNSPITGYQWQRNGVDIPSATFGTYLRTVDYRDDSTFYRVAITNAAGTVYSQEALLRVNFAPRFVTLSDQGQIGFSGDSLDFEIRVLANPPPTYNINYTVGMAPVVSPAQTDSQKTLTIRAPVPLGPIGAVNAYMVTASNFLGSRTTYLTVNCYGYREGPPVFWLHPSSFTIAAGSRATLQAGVGGIHLHTLQWRRNGVDIPGANSVFLVRDPIGPEDDGAVFSLVATNFHGSVTSQSATISVLHAPVIDSQPAPATLASGGSHTFGVSARGNPAPTFQWRRNGADIAGATASSYTVASAGSGLDGSSYSVRISNDRGSVISEEAALSVLHVPVIVSGPASAGVLAGQSHTFAVEVRANPAAAFQWRRNGLDIPGATGPAWTTPPATISDDGSFYTVEVSNSQGTVTGGPAVLHVEPIQAPPTIVSQPQDLFLYPGDNAVFRIGVSGEPHPGVSWSIMGGSFEPGPYLGDSLWLGPVEVADHGLRVLATVQNQAGTVMSREAVLWVNQRPTRHLVSLTGELFDASNLSPMGYDHEAGADVIVNLYTQAEGGTAVYTEEFLRAEGRGVVVDRGLFTVRLGQGRTGQNLSEAVARHDNLYAELTVQVEDLMRETLLPRTPITSPLVAGTPRILQGVTDPVATEPVGTYYENTATGATWLRMPASWIRIAP